MQVSTQIGKRVPRFLKVTETPQWAKPERVYFTLIAIGAFVLLIWLLAEIGAIGPLYEWFWQNTIGRTYTSWFREHPFVFLFGAIGVLGGAAWVLPPHLSARIILIAVAFFIGYVGGHAFWTGEFSFFD